VSLPTKVSDWLSKARKRWPRSFEENQILGDGRYAVLTCPFLHPSAGQMMYSEVYLFETQQKAEDFNAELDTAQSGQHCYAQTKGLCSRNHELIDLSIMKLAS
jgi:hypothetical protein